MIAKLSPDIEQLVAENHGMARLDGQQASYVVMSDQTYRELLGIGTDDELRESIAAIEQGLADAEAGRTRPFREVIAELRGPALAR